MNPIDPARDPIKQLDHDVRGMRYEIEIMGRMLVESINSGKKVRRNLDRQIWITRSLAVLVAVLFALVMCSPTRTKGFWRYADMGYTNGEECYKANCAKYPNLEDRIGCCATSCPTLSEDCVKAALHDTSMNVVFMSISRSGRKIRGTDQATKEEKQRATVALERIAAQTEFDTYRQAADAVLQVNGI